MAARRRRGNSVMRRRSGSWLKFLSLVAALGLGYLAMREDEAARSGKSPSAVFAVFARLDVDVDEVRRMRPSPIPPSAKPAGAPWRTIVEVVDGDSLRLDGGEMVRLLGIDAPEASANNKLNADIGKMRMQVSPNELVAMGREAAGFAGRLARGRRCWIERDRAGADQYDRTLGYVHLEDGSILNEMMISEGYAKVYMPQAFTYKQRYILLQIDARLNKRGLWGRE